MNDNAIEIQKKSKKSLKWSTFGEIIGRLITPITTAILSRILAPEIFGIVTTITIVISFCEIFSDGGFSKYIIQSDFVNEDEKAKSINVAFWSNFVLSTILFILICLFNRQIANFIGCDGYEISLIIACLQVPIYSINGIFVAVFRREFKFKQLFYIRVITALINFCCSVPLAFLGFKHWSIIIGNIISITIVTIIIMFMSKWKPKLFFSLKLLKNMFSFSSLNLLESILVWLCTWVSSIIISNGMSQYYLGIYKNAKSMVNSLFGIVTASIIPVLFSSLSRLKDNEEAFNDMYYKMQSLAAFILLPMGAGLFLYRDLATKILFGSQWGDAGIVVGVSCAVKSLVVVFSYFASEVYRAKGKPIISIFTQIILLIISTPICLLTVKSNFTNFVIASSCADLTLVVMSFVFLKIKFKMKLKSIVLNFLRPFVCCIIMIVVSLLLKQVKQTWWFDIISIIICIITYFGAYLMLFYKDFICKMDVFISGYSKES